MECEFFSYFSATIGARMSDELEARMWDDGGSRYESRSRGAYFESAFPSSEHLDRAPLLSEVRKSELFFYKNIKLFFSIYT